MNDEYFNLNESINSLFDNVSVDDINKSKNVNDTWNQVLKSINSKNSPNIGNKLAFHSKVVDLKNGVLLVEVDHPGWINLLNLYKNYILKGLKMKMKVLKIETLAFRLKGSKYNLYDTRSEEERIKESKDKLEKKLEDDEEKLKKFDDNKVSNKELPEELVKVFENMKNSMLTNSKD